MAKKDRFSGTACDLTVEQLVGLEQRGVTIKTAMRDRAVVRPETGPDEAERAAVSCPVIARNMTSVTVLTPSGHTYSVPR